MIEAISASLSQAALSHTTPANRPTEALNGPEQEPNGAMAADFARAVSSSNAAMAHPATSAPTPSHDAKPSATPTSFEIEAAAPPKGTSLTKRISHDATSFLDHLNSLTPERDGSERSGPDATASNSQSVQNVADGNGATHVPMDHAMDQLERIYASVTETALAGTGLTQAGNVFNTLLKGQ